MTRNVLTLVVSTDTQTDIDAAIEQAREQSSILNRWLNWADVVVTPTDNGAVETALVGIKMDDDNKDFYATSLAQEAPNGWSARAFDIGADDDDGRQFLLDRHYTLHRLLVDNADEESDYDPSTRAFIIGDGEYDDQYSATVADFAGSVEHTVERAGVTLNGDLPTWDDA